MAVTSIWPIKGRVATVIDYARNPEKTREESSSALHKIDDVIQYAANELKTEYRAFVTCINCSSEEAAAREFMEAKEIWRKTEGRQCFHGYQSFRPGEVDAKTAHEIGVELAQRCWGDRFQIVVATHCNTGCYHNHFVLNSVSYTDGLHFDNRPEDYRYMRAMSDWLCEKYKLSVIENPIGHGKHYTEILAEKKGHKSIRTTIREDIDLAIRASITFDQFCSELKEKGYEFKLFTENGEPLVYPALKPLGAKGYFRFHKLGDGYELYQIKRRLHRKLKHDLPFPDEEQEIVRRYRKEHPPKIEGLSGLHKLYVRYCYELRIIERYPASVKRVPFHMREDLMYLEKLDAETQILGKNHISTIEDLRDHKQQLRSKISTLEAQRHDLRNEIRRLNRSGYRTSAEAARQQVSSLTGEIRKIRKELALCDDIELRSAQTQEELEYLLRQQREEQMRKESPVQPNRDHLPSI